MNDELETLRRIESMLAIPFTVPLDECRTEAIADFAPTLDAKLDNEMLANRLLESLTESERQVVLRRFNGDDYQEIVADLHISRSTAYRIFKDAMHKLKETLAEYMAVVAIDMIRRKLSEKAKKGGD